MSSIPYVDQKNAALHDKIEKLDELSLVIQAKCDSLSGQAFLSWLSHYHTPELAAILSSSKKAICDHVRTAIQDYEMYLRRELDGSDGGNKVTRVVKMVNFPQSQWVIDHDLGFEYPRPLFLDENFQELEGEIDWKASNQYTMVVNFSTPVMGRAILCLA